MKCKPYIHFILLLGIMLGPLQDSSAQVFPEYYRSVDYPRSDSGSLSFFANTSTFFNNHEYFDAEVKGYTLIGAYFQPTVHYSINHRLSIGAGIHLLKYFGQENFKQSQPIFRIDYRVTDRFLLTMGSFNGGMNFDLPEPIYHFENHFTQLVNNGIRLAYRSPVFSSRTWINWETFIEPGDPFREEFTFGSANEITLLKGATYEINLPFSIISHHKGGQIDQSEKPVETVFDFAFGLKMKEKFNSEFFRELRFEPYAFFEQNDEDFEEGYAIWPRIILTTKWAELSGGYFYGENYNSYWGNPLFFSGLTADNATYPFSETQFITFKAGLGKKLTGHSGAVLSFSGYFDTNSNKLQYFYGLHMIISEWYKLY